MLYLILVLVVLGLISAIFGIISLPFQGVLLLELLGLQPVLEPYAKVLLTINC